MLKAGEQIHLRELTVAVGRSAMSRQGDVIANESNRPVAIRHVKAGRVIAAPAEKVLGAGPVGVRQEIGDSDDVVVEAAVQRFVVGRVLTVVIAVRIQVFFADEVTVAGALADFAQSDFAPLKNDAVVMGRVIPGPGSITGGETGRAAVELI